MNFVKNIMNRENGVISLYYLGQAGFVLKSEAGNTVAIDLYLSDCVEKDENNIGYKRLLPALFEPSEIELDCIIATHPHLDHYDRDSIPKLMKDTSTRLYASVNCQQYVERDVLDQNRVTYVRPGETYTYEDIIIHTINCDHGEAARDAVGIILESNGRRICFVGDTCLRLDRKKEYLKYGNLDILVGPINGAFGNMNEYEFAELCYELNPNLSIPCHFGMFASHGGTPQTFIDTMNTKYQETKYTLMTLGERIDL